MKKKKHFLSMILGLALSLTILFPSFAQASEIPNQLLSSYEYDDTVHEIVRKHLNFDSIDFKRNNHITIELFLLRQIFYFEYVRTIFLH